jgi:hydrogenase maturation protein HypF
MELEFACGGLKNDECYPYAITPITGEDGLPRYIIDYEMLIGEIITDWQAGVVKGLIALKFHNTLAKMMVSVARLVGEKRVVLTGGCFQNKLLLEQAISRLLAAGFEPYWHQHIPTNDGGIALGQIVAGALHQADAQKGVPTSIG